VRKLTKKTITELRKKWEPESSIDDSGFLRNKVKKSIWITKKEVTHATMHRLYPSKKFGWQTIKIRKE
jgi:hypothetical protein